MTDLTLRDAMTLAQRRVWLTGHARLDAGTVVSVHKWVAQCLDCGATLIVERTRGDRPWSFSGNTMRRTCAAIRASKGR